MANYLDARLPEQFWEKTMPEPMGGCWLWVGAWTTKGYGFFYSPREGDGEHRVRYRVHNVAFKALVGNILPGLVLDHKCRVRCCCNPDHLEPVTQQTNTLRGVGPTAHNAKLTHCSRCGSKLIRRRNGKRRCKVCSAKRLRDRRRHGRAS